MISVANYVAKTIADHGIDHIFMVTGGAAMFLNNAFGSEERIRCVFNHHEQACAIAAEGYARISGKIGVINVTSGPGGINAINGVFGAWTDSIPMLIISGQVKRETLSTSYQCLNLRQLGDQEADIIGMVKGITKSAVQILDPKMIAYELEKAIFLSKSGRSGPCWIDIPIDVQSSLIDENEIQHFDPWDDTIPSDLSAINSSVLEVYEILAKAKRPVILAGTGVRLSDATSVFEKAIQELGIPVTTAWTHDLIASDNPYFCGRPGTIGTRGGNFVVQNADVLLVLGSRLNIRQISYNWTSFAHDAFIIQVDIDKNELNKPTVKPNLGIHSDVKFFLEQLVKILENKEFPKQNFINWLNWCKERNARYPVIPSIESNNNNYINPYHLISYLTSSLEENDVIVTGNGAACIITFQTAKLKKGQRLFSNSGCASMGYDLPAAIGASLSRPNQRVICIAGDGSFQMNIQELQTIKQYNLNIKCFIINNNGYLSIRSSQKNFFYQLTGESPASGLSLPNYVSIAKAYGLEALQISGPNFEEEIQKALLSKGAIICEVIVDPEQGFEPRMSSRQLPDGRIISPSLEDMYPFLDRNELNENMISSQGLL